MGDSIERFWSAHLVRATRRIEDNPLAREDRSADRGTGGDVVDVDGANEVVFVDFGDGAIPCTADELTPIG